MKATRTFAITLLGIVALGLAGWLGWAAFGPDAAEGEGREFTYLNVSLALPPEESGLHAVADYAPPESGDKPGGGPIVVVTDDSEAHSGYMVIDANTGEVLVDTIGGSLRDEADDVKASIREPEGDVAVWPLVDVEPPVGRERTLANITYVHPDPLSGIFVVYGDEMGSGPSLFFHNGQSRMLASQRIAEGAANRLRFEMRVLPEDRAAFERLAATIRLEAP
jgi:hypothetical protein